MPRYDRFLELILTWPGRLAKRQFSRKGRISDDLLFGSTGFKLTPPMEVEMLLLGFLRLVLYSCLSAPRHSNPPARADPVDV